MNTEYYYAVEGRRFSEYLHAITFAQRIAEEMDRDVEVRRNCTNPNIYDYSQWEATLKPVTS